MKGQSLQAVLDRSLALADAQVVLAREYGFDNWAQLKHRVEVGRRVATFTPHPRFMDLLLEHGATLDLKSPAGVVPDWRRQHVLDLPLANHAPRAAEKMIELGAKPDVCAAAAVGRMDLLRDGFDQEGRLRSRPRRGGRVMTERDAIAALLEQHGGKRAADL